MTEHAAEPVVARPAAATPQTAQELLPSRPRSFAHLLLYAVSLPERAVRSLAGFAGMLGLALARLLPGPVRATKVYRLIFMRYMRLLTDDLGGAGRFPKTQAMDFNTAARLGVSSVVDNLCILTLHASPLWILLAARDVADGARALVHEVVEDLKAEGLVQEGSRLDNVDLLLGAIATVSERTSDTLDMPPLRVEDLKRSLADIKAELATASHTAMVDVAQIDRLAHDIRDLAKASGQPPMDVLTGLAVKTAEKGGKLVLGTGHAAFTSVRFVSKFLYEGVILDYSHLLADLRKKGLWRAMAETLAPHVSATRSNFAMERLTATEMGLSFGRLRNAPWRKR